MINDAQTTNIIYRLSSTNAFAFFSFRLMLCAAAGRQPTEGRKPKPKVGGPPGLLKAGRDGGSNLIGGYPIGNYLIGKGWTLFVYFSIVWEHATENSATHRGECISPH